MARREHTSVLVRMPKSLKRRLGREVSRRDSTLNDVAVAILADEFDVEFTPSGRRGPAPGESGDVLLRVPPDLKRKLDDAARERRSSTNTVVVESLTERFAAATPRKDPMPRDASQNGKACGNGKVRVAIIGVRSEERRVGKECRCGWAAEHE